MARIQEAFRITDPGENPVEAIAAVREFTILKIMRDWQFSQANPEVGPPEINVSRDPIENAVQLRMKGMDEDAALDLGQGLAERFNFYMFQSPFNPRGGSR